MPQNFFIVGDPKAGKTTLLKELVRELKKNGVRVGGFISPEERHHGTRTAFRIMDLETGKIAPLADVDGDGPKINKYHVNIRSFEDMALPIMKKAKQYDVIIIDEIGAMELKSPKFSDVLDDLLEAKIPLIATLHHEYIESYGPYGEIVELDQENRQAVYLRILRKTVSSLAKKKPSPQKMRTVEKQNPVTKAKKKTTTYKTQNTQPEIPVTKPKMSAASPAISEIKKSRTKINETDEIKETAETKKKKGILDTIKELLHG